ncbi:MAG: hypothetical protein ABSB30_07395 [Terracidiphilus sp.]|jgi:hypothetical protein
MNSETSRNPDLTPGSRTSASSVSIVVQIVALVLGFVAVAWGIFSAYGAAFPGPCGDEVLVSGLVVMESWLLDLPAGLLILLVGLFVSKGSSRLRWICIVTALVTLALPVLASFLLQQHHCP